MLRHKKYHFIGIGGIGMSGIAKLLLSLGYEVTGSDLRRSEITKQLEAQGARIFYGHHPQNILGAEVVVYSSAIKPNNPELLEAKRLGLEVIPRAAMLVEIMKLHHFNIAVAGAHGKTTTSSMIAAVLTAGGLKPTVAVGGKVNGFAGNAWLGKRDYLVAEADESDGSFLRMRPNLAVVTNIDREHLDFYPDLEAVKRAFLSFLNSQLEPEGTAVLCLDDPGTRELIPRIKREVITYGFSPAADLRAKVIREAEKTLFGVFYQGLYLGEATVYLPGRHNVLNALATIGVGLKLGLPFQAIVQGLSAFRGVRRRLEVKAEVGGILILDDYAHHPTEIKATLAALRTAHPERRLVVLFQPHRYTRTKALFEDFVRSFDQVDLLLLTKIYPASEAPLPGVSGERLYSALKERRKGPTFFAENKELLLARTLSLLEPGDLVVTMGAGDIYRVGEALVEELGLREEVA